MRVRMADQRAIHIEQGDPAEIAVYDPQSRRHSCLQSGVRLPGNEPPLDLIGSDRQTMPTIAMTGGPTYPGPTCMVSTVRTCQAFSNYDADAIIGATVSEIMTRKSPSFIPATIGASSGLPRHDGGAVACHLA